MTPPPPRSVPRPPKKTASPAERSEEFAEVQRRLKREAAERRLKNPGKATGARTSRRVGTAHPAPPADPPS
jgi:hypothetical protein